jgi:predicted HicB family RNase H-like nuclease
MARVNFELPDELHRRAKARAALEGSTLREFIIEAVRKAVEAPAAKPRGLKR